MSDSEQKVEQNPVGEKQILATRVRGRVKWFNVKIGYGFITRDCPKEDVFCHQTAITKTNPNKFLRSVGDGEAVEFDVVQGKKGKEAANVTGPDGVAVQGSKYAPDRRRNLGPRMGGSGAGYYNGGYQHGGRRQGRGGRGDNHANDGPEESRSAEVVEGRERYLRPRPNWRGSYRAGYRGPPRLQLERDGQVRNGGNRGRDRPPRPGMRFYQPRGGYQGNGRGRGRGYKARFVGGERPPRRESEADKRDDSPVGSQKQDEEVECPSSPGSEPGSQIEDDVSQQTSV